MMLLLYSTTSDGLAKGSGDDIDDIGGNESSTTHTKREIARSRHILLPRWKLREIKGTP